MLLGCCYLSLHSHHHDLLEAAKEEPVLVYEGLHHVLQVRPHRLELVKVPELVLEQGRPPADRQVLAVHAVHLAALGHSAKEVKLKNISFSNLLLLPDEVLEEELKHSVVGSGQPLQQLLGLEQPHVPVGHHRDLLQVRHVLLKYF